MSDLSEPYGIMDIFCDGIDRIDRLGPCRRLVFTVRDMAPGHPCRAIVAKVVVPAEVMVLLARMSAADVNADTDPVVTPFASRAAMN